MKTVEKCSNLWRMRDTTSYKSTWHFFSLTKVCSCRANTAAIIFSFFTTFSQHILIFPIPHSGSSQKMAKNLTTKAFVFLSAHPLLNYCYYHISSIKKITVFFLYIQVPDQYLHVFYPDTLIYRSLSNYHIVENSVMMKAHSVYEDPIAKNGRHNQHVPSCRSENQIDMIGRTFPLPSVQKSSRN